MPKQNTTTATNNAILDCDPRPGYYYVSVIDGPRHALVAGPFDTHRAALDMVKRAENAGNECDPKSVFYGWGTCRLERDETKPMRTGVLNSRLGLADGLTREVA
ncbi:MAG: hypothetical protein WC455_15545 [Dehalococcoidia bacterium]|jgi:hypothetical protein